MERRFDLVVIGTGVASAVASRCREAGWTVAVVDYRPFGGTCALRGCIPKKILVSAAEAVHGARTMADRGVRPGEVSIDWPDLIRVKRTDGTTVSFKVDRLEQWPKADFPTRRVYGRTRKPALRLVTCSGDFDRATGHYTDNTIVYASPR